MFVTVVINWGNNVAVCPNVSCHTVKRTFRSTPEASALAVKPKGLKSSISRNFAQVRLGKLLYYLFPFFLYVLARNLYYRLTCRIWLGTSRDIHSF